MRPLARGLRLARLCGLCVDARRACRTRDLLELAHASRWIAANLCAIRGVPVTRTALPARLVGVRAHDLDALWRTLASAPSLVDAELLPIVWRVALRGLGVPLLERPVAQAIDAGVSVIVPQHVLGP